MPNSIYTVADPQDLLHREPLVATFRVRGVPSHEAFQFKLVNIHTDPDETKTELDALGDVFVVLRGGDRETAAEPIASMQIVHVREQSASGLLTVIRDLGTARGATVQLHRKMP